MKICVIMSAFNRQGLLDRTLGSIARTAATDVSVVLVDDASTPPLKVPAGYRFRIRKLVTHPEHKFWTSVPAVPFNRAIAEALAAGADTVVLQSPECFHVGDVLRYVEERACSGLYLTFACFAADKAQTADPAFPRGHKLRPAETYSGGPPGWFNHSQHRPGFLEFCAAVSAADLRRLNGYDERFADGVACGDCDLLRRVRNLELTTAIVDDPFVVHQWHYDEPSPYRDFQRYKRNQEMLARTTEREPANYRAVHLFTDDFEGS